MRIERGAVLLTVAVVASGAAIASMQTAHGAGNGTSCTNGNGRGWETGYDDARIQCFDTRPRGGPDTLWCITWYRNGNAQGSCQWASAARK